MVAACPPGTVVLGGGYDVGSIAPGVVVARSRPAADVTGWELWIHNGEPYAVNIAAYAICGTP
jgi:hypothetical protein